MDNDVLVLGRAKAEHKIKYLTCLSPCGIMVYSKDNIDKVSEYSDYTD